MYSTFNTYNPTKEDLIANAPEGATHFVKEDRDYNFTWLKKVLSTWQCRTLDCDRWTQWLGSFPDFIYELPSVSVVEESPTTIRERIPEIRKEREAGINEEQDLIDKLASMGFKLVDKINEKLEEAKEQHELQDWRNWKAGDLLERVDKRHPLVYVPGKLYVVKSTEPEICVYDEFGGDSYCQLEPDEYGHFKFHSRPTK